MTRALAEAFVRRTEHADRRLDLEGLEIALAELLAAARARWPEVAFDPVAVVESLADSWAPADPAASLVELPPFAVDLVLAQACLRGELTALRVLRREMFARADLVLGRLRLPPADHDDVRQEVEAKLLVGERPKLAQYDASGPLPSWIASVAGREGLVLLRRRQPTEALDEDGLFDDDDDPELAVLNARHGADFKRAFQAAVSSLSPRDRTVLRALLVDDRSVNDIAALYRVHRVTASRWISEIRRTLLLDTRRRLQQALQLDPSSVDSAIRIVAGQLELSLYRLLGAQR